MVAEQPSTRSPSERSQDRAEPSSEAEFLERFMRLLSHDLRNPISAIKLATSILARDTQDPDARRRTVQRITSNADRLLRTLEDSLDYTRLRSGQGLALELAPTDLEALCRAVLTALEAAYPSRRLALETAGAVESTCDKERLARALSNLISATVEQAAPDSETLIRLQTGSDVVIIIENGSLELDAEEITALFDPPFRHESAKPSARRTRGFGLGLHMAKAIAAAHGGSLRAESASPGGTRLALTLPRKDPAPPKEPAEG